jgi:hypothetical protein
MLIYTGEEDDETLEKLGIELPEDEDVDDATIGFCEMMSIKIGADLSDEGQPSTPSDFQRPSWRLVVLVRHFARCR